MLSFVTFEFPSAMAAARFFDAVIGEAGLSHRVVELQNVLGADVESVRALARVHGGQEVS